MGATTAPIEHGFTVTVTHDPSQSFTRAVDPRAMREARAYMADRGMPYAVCIAAEYGHDQSEGRCRSTLLFLTVKEWTA